MLPDFNSETRFGILSSYHNFITPIGKDLHISFFHPLMVGNFKTLITLGVQSEHFWEYKPCHVDQREKRTRIGGHTWMDKKLKNDQP